MFPWKLLMWTTCQVHVFQTWSGVNSPKLHPQDAFKLCSCLCWDAETTSAHTGIYARLICCSMIWLSGKKRCPKSACPVSEICEVQDHAWGRLWTQEITSPFAGDTAMKALNTERPQWCTKEHADQTWSNHIEQFIVLLQICSLDDTEESCRISTTDECGPKIMCCF